jgi:phage-related protein (TIGR01555 family)
MKRSTQFVGQPNKTYNEADAAYAFSGLLARAIDVLPNACFSKGFGVNEISGDDITDLESALTDLDAFRKMAEAFRLARQYGGAIVYMVVNDGKDSREPVDLNRIASVSSLLAFDSTEVTIALYGTTIGSDWFGMPEVYQISPGYGEMFYAHASRCLHFDAIQVGRSQKRRMYCNRGFSPSFIDRIWTSFEAYGATNQYFAKTVEKLTQGVLKLNRLNESMDGGNARTIMNRLQVLLATMSSIGDIVVDKDEEYSITSRNVTGFSDASQVFVDWLVADSGVPRSILMGQTAGGIADGNNDGDWKSFAMSVGAEQINRLEPLASKLIKYILASTMSPVADPPRRFTVLWPPILQMSEKEKAEIYSLRATGRASDILASVISPVEARKSDDVIETYHLDAGDDAPIPEPEEDDGDE